MRIDRDALLCDFAQYYHIYDFEKPISLLAVLAWGLPDSSRIKMKIADTKYTPEMLVLGGIFDRVNLLLWINTKDGQKGKNRPKPLFAEESAKKVKGFGTAEEFEKVRREILERNGSNGK